MSSIPNGQKDEWSSASQELFRAARSDHAPTSADRERVRRALAERIAAGHGASGASSASSASSASGSGASGVGGMAGHAASALSRVLKLGLGVSLVVVATIAVKRVQEPAHSEQSSGVQAASRVSSAASEVSSTLEQRAANGTAAHGGDPARQPGADVASAAELAAQAKTADSPAQGRRDVSGRGVGPARDVAAPMRDAAAMRGAAPKRGAAPMRDAVAQSRDGSSQSREGASQSREGTTQSRDESSVRGGRRAQAHVAQTSVGATARASLPSEAAIEDDSQPDRASTGDAARHTPETDARLARAEPSAAPTRVDQARASEQAKARDASRTAVQAPRVEQSDERAARPSKVEEQEDGPADDARAELAFVRKMQAALRTGEADDVLELCDEHAQRWPHGTFVQEREGLRAIASCNTSAQSAEARAKAFLSKYPRTPLGPRVREACKLQLKAAGTPAAESGAASKTGR